MELPKGMEISVELKTAVERQQNEMKTLILKHQAVYQELLKRPNDPKLKEKLASHQMDIITLGLEQKLVFDQLRSEQREYQKSLKAEIVKNGVDKKQNELSTAVKQARKQHIVVRSSPVTSFSDDSIDATSPRSSEYENPVEPHDVSQTKFLAYFCLATHDVYKEMQNKRAERKRRSTANPQFLYSNRNWEVAKRQKRSNYLVSSISPPNTRQAVKKKNERTSPTAVTNNINTISGNGSVDNSKTNLYSGFPSIPNLPSGLTIERISPTSSSPELKSCVTCKYPGGLTICEMCSNGFHINCHNRPFAQTPRRCPVCIFKEVQNSIDVLPVPSGMNVSYISSTSEVSD